MVVFVFASITVWYIFGEKFHKCGKREEKRRTQKQAYDINQSNISTK
jgi:hypothetical protein